LTGGVEDYAYSAGFRLDTVTKATGVESYGYDGAGRVTSFARDGSFNVLEYNSDDKLTRSYVNGQDIQYAYDGVGRRVAKVESGHTFRYLTAPNLGDGFETPQAMTDAAGNVQVAFVFAGEHPVMRIENGVPTYLLQDAMGSVIGAAQANGESAGTVHYDGFGNVRAELGGGAHVGGELRLPRHDPRPERPLPRAREDVRPEDGEVYGEGSGGR
jgi:YD repeat-containing protein